MKALIILLTLLLARPASADSVAGCGLQLLNLTGRTDRMSTMLDVVEVLEARPARRAAAILVLGVVETKLNPKPPRGQAGEIGTFQVMPSNLKHLRARCQILGSPSTPVVNAQYAYCYLDEMLTLSGGDLYAAVAAYNAGPKAIDLVKQRRPLPSVTANYLVKFIRLWETTVCSKT